MRLLPLLAAAAAPMIVSTAAPAQPSAPSFALPIDCRIGVDCEIQNYVDRDPGPGAKDYQCGTRSYQNHSGVDFRLPTLARQRQGVAVLAAADGRVLRVREGVADVSVRAADAASVEGAECGNGVVIGHEGGLETQYCHMAQGSLRVKPGDVVKAGAPVGRVGLSGNTEYPHLHFTVRRGGRWWIPSPTVRRPAPATPVAACGAPNCARPWPTSRAPCLTPGSPPRP
jgi:murein DD-endopeptidase MepM/ murein hydrolase activator NlpD